MDQESLRLLVRRKLQDGRLPHDGIRRVAGSPSAGETCDACDAILAMDQLLMEGINGPVVDGRDHAGSGQEAPSVARPMFPDVGSREARHLVIRANLS